MAAVKISGVLRDGTGKPVPGCIIELKAKRTSETVIATTVAYGMPEETGSYSMDVEPGIYRVTLNTEGYRPSYVGDIVVREDSSPGTLNKFLMESKRLVRTVLIFTESSDQLSRATDRVPGLPASPGYVQ
ncbi:prophage tail fiber N-terminal domain-containing protein, partial [Escherichia coli]